MAGITSAFATSAKSEFFSGAHNFRSTITPTGNTTSASASVTSLSSATGIVVGDAITGTGIPASTVVATIDSASQVTLSKNATATGSGVTLTVTADTFKIALFRATASIVGTYDATTVNYTDMTGNSDEVSGTGYTATGAALTNVSPTTSGTTAFVDFTPDPSWTSATFTTSGCMIYNSSVRLGGTSGTNTTGGGRCLGVFSFGGDQAITAGTLSVVFPTPNSSNAIFRIG